ncbi:MAG: malonic semialdehyde reductase [Sciscionella sp.]
MTTTEAPDLIEIDRTAQDLLFRQARTANSFSDEPVSDEQLAAVYELTKWAPTSMNNQPLRITVLRSEPARRRLLPLLSEGNRTKTDAAPVTVILAADTEFHERLPEVFPHAPDAKNMFADAEARARTAKLNALLQVGYFIIGVRAAGLAAGPMTGFDAEAVDREFYPEGTRKSLVVVNIGKPGEDAWFGRLPRLAHQDVLTTL